ncbi:hypothetical protein KVR01_011772 [Diaporthe batatas]|uniref:uncharacterized protein n=1 Tax=Diaporthe batatas TaxID=748121 RepID=UPI001D048D55|nr:uncharacterized protein KVR01_011772 [Diaporthe batatas]KAG8158650.1 hypothetical protein KVR01_011772 [Diaporthe batatas]
MGNTKSVTAGAQDPAQRRPSPLELVDLLLTVLPVVSELCKDLSNTINKRDKRYGYLGNIQSATATLHQHLVALSREGCNERLGSQIGDLADQLEQIFSPHLIPSQGGLVSADVHTNIRQYQRLTRVKKLLAESGDELPFPSPKDLLDTNMLNSPGQWRRLQHELECITDEFQGYGDDADHLDEDTLAHPNHSSPEMWTFADEVFKAMSCDCHSQSLSGSRLRMGTYRAGSNHVAKSLCVLLEQLQESEQWVFWHEVLIREHVELKPRVKFSNTSQADPSQEAHEFSASGAVSCIFDVLQEPSTADLLRLNFILNRGVLHTSSNAADERTIRQDSLREEVNLKDILASPQKRWPETAKWALAVILAWSLHHLYGGSWTRGGWSRENILFFRSGGRIPLRPFLGISDTNILHKDKKSTEISSLHRYPELLELGVILLELHLGQRLEDYLGLNKELSGPRDFFLHAMKAFASQKEHIFSLRYRNAIDTCLRPDPKLRPNPSMQDVRCLMFQNVVKPLEEELTSNFQEWFSAGGLDDQAEKYDLAVGLHIPNQSLGAQKFTSAAIPTDDSIHPLLRSRGRR